MQRLISFDIAKAICIILVVIGHYIPDSSPSWYVGEVVRKYQRKLLFVGWFACLRSHRHRADARLG